MDGLARALQELQREFAVPATVWQDTAETFRAELAAGLSGGVSSLPLLPAYAAHPSGRERGRCLALDMGGTNVRAMLVELRGDGRLRVLRQVRRGLRDVPQGYDYTVPATPPAALFAFLARVVGEVAPAGERLPLGFTFSYPCLQNSRTNAVLLRWNKEIDIPGAVGRDVGELLKEALARERVPAALQVIINDTVGTQLAGAYRDPACRAGVIIGPGFTACYLAAHAFAPPGRIGHLGAGDFAGVAPNRYDRRLDAASVNPGGQRLEKMVAGRYLGELARLVAGNLARQGPLWPGAVPAALAQPYAVPSEDIGGIIADPAPGQPLPASLLRRRGGVDDTAAARAALRRICTMVVWRSARLAGAVLCGLLRHDDPGLARRHVIAVDGALYGGMPGYARCVSLLLQEALGAAARNVVLRLTPDGSGLGAVIAAAPTEPEQASNGAAE